MNTPLLSLVVPLHNEERVIETLLDRSIRSLGEITQEFELICVDDGSTDRSLAMLFERHTRDPRVKVVSLSRKFGHQAAYTAGLSYAKGSYVAMMDGDLQDPPELLKPMYERLTAGGFDVVYGKRRSRGERFGRKVVLRIFHSVFHDIASLQPNEDVGNFAMFNRPVHAALLSLSEKTRYLPGLRFFVGFRQQPIEYDRSDRLAGASKMRLGELFALAFDAIFSFSDVPIKFSIYAGLFGVLTFFAGTVYTVVSKLAGFAPIGWSSILISIYFWGSIQLLFLGILGEYIFRIYRETQNRPLYIVREFIG
jgi:dolichol-phosphate mannosyltransferase